MTPIDLQKYCLIKITKFQMNAFTIVSNRIWGILPIIILANVLIKDKAVDLPYLGTVAITTEQSYMLAGIFILLFILTIILCTEKSSQRYAL